MRPRSPRTSRHVEALDSRSTRSAGYPQRGLRADRRAGADVGTSTGEIVGIADPLVLPQPWGRPPRPPLPLVAATVPVVGAIALWLLTGSVLTLWIAALGPLIAVATTFDASRAARRDRRAADLAAAAARTRVSAEVVRRHGLERRAAEARHPDVTTYLHREREVWRIVPGRADALVVGRGATASAVRVIGGDDEESERIRRDALRVPDIPITVPLQAGVAVAGPPALAAAVLRALVLQACLALPPSELHLLGETADENAWSADLPHRRVVAGARRLAVHGPGEVPAEAEAVLVRIHREDPPARCAAVLRVESPERARLDFDGRVRDVRVEAVGIVQAERIAAELSARSGAAGLDPGAAVALSELLRLPVEPSPGGLNAVIGRQDGRPVALDLVRDGPHAVVAGVTGSGKSELLISWVVAVCAKHDVGAVTFLLADFKGGTAFDGLAPLPHVVGVITDLDGSGARRAFESLRAEMRWREGELARRGARDIDDERVNIPRLVVVVDEFAAVLHSHPELVAMFSDVAARGRALGIHLILGTQRVSGVVRDSLLANCPLRIGLRLIDAVDSRVLLGVDDAARLPGGQAERGRALVRRAQDAAPQPMRVGLSSADDIVRVAASASTRAVRRPWLPALPTDVPLADLRARSAPAPGLILGLADEPDRQRQEPVTIAVSDRGLLVIGAAGSGRSTTLRTLAAQAGGVREVPADPERGWDAVADLDETPPDAGTVIVLDDFDALVSRLPGDYAGVLISRVERLVRSAGERGVLVVASAQRVGGSIARVTDLLPRRAVLRLTTRADHLAAGGDPSHHRPDSPRGRARLDGVEVQIARAASAERGTPEEPLGQSAWIPAIGTTGFVARRGGATREVVRAWAEAGVDVRSLDDVSGVADVPAAAPGRPLVLVGDPEQWQRDWRVLGHVRAEHALAIDVACTAEYRLLSGERDLPPYCAHGAPRAWLCDGARVRRIVLPSPR